MAKKRRKGEAVSWRFGGSTTEGNVVERFTSRVTRTIKGKRITRKATEDDPAYLVKTKDGKRALKSGRQLRKR